jgi:hypothetical protein
MGKPGRPKKPGQQRVNYLIPETLAKAIQKQAKLDGRSQGDCVADGIRWYLKRAANRARLKPKGKG